MTLPRWLTTPFSTRPELRPGRALLTPTWLAALALLGEWDDFGWSGPAQENMTLEWAWTPTGEGRTRGSIVEVDGVGDMKHGDLALEECFGADGYLTWRQINDAYLVEAPEYNLGDPKSCALGVDAFDK